MNIARDRRIAALVVQWFLASARDLPWRKNRTGYSALVSETMLQQTQVSRVVDAFAAFMRQFPTVRALAEANEQEVLAAWQGLGYYRRARHLHQAAKAVIEQYKGRVPREVHDLQQLPGVGRYTAGAIASIVFNKPAPIVDGNVQRVLARLEAIDGATHSSAFQNAIWDRAQRLVEATQEFASLNEGLMELGAVACTPVKPRCNECPLRRLCIARQTGRIAELPTPRRAPRRQSLHHHAVVIERSGSILLEQRPSKGLWSSMWQTPTVEAAKPLNIRAVHDAMTVPLRSLHFLESFHHHTTHREIAFHIFRGSTSVRRGTWRAVDSLHLVPMSNAHRKVLARGLNSSKHPSTIKQTSLKRTL